MRYVAVVLLLALMSFSTLVFGRSRHMYYNYDQQARIAYSKVLGFRFKEAKVILDHLKKSNPNNLAAHHIENYIDLFKAYTGAEDYSFDQFKADRNERLELVELGDPNSPYYLFVQAEIRLHAALVRWKFGEYFGAFQDVARAYRLLEKNGERFPHFMANKKDLGILHAFMGTVPSTLKWGISLVSGLEGTIFQGIEEIEEVIKYSNQNDFIFKEETEILYVLLKLHLENQQKEAWDIMQSLNLAPKTKTLHCYIMAEVAMDVGKNDEAIRILQNRPHGTAYYQFHLLDLMLGNALLRKLDPSCRLYFEDFIKNTKGQQFIKSAYQKLAWNELIHGNVQGYHLYMEDCRTKGSTSTGEDESAKNEAEAENPPLPILVKARLLFDGGYYEQAYQLLVDTQLSSFNKASQELEYYYRLARILHALGNVQAAVKYYQLTIDKGRYLPQYYACNAAFKMGIMYENNKQHKLAQQAYENCLTIKPKAYRYSIHQQAKAGLNRLENKQ